MSAQAVTAPAETANTALDIPAADVRAAAEAVIARAEDVGSLDALVTEFEESWAARMAIPSEDEGVDSPARDRQFAAHTALEQYVPRSVGDLATVAALLEERAREWEPDHPTALTPVLAMIRRLANPAPTPVRVAWDQAVAKWDAAKFAYETARQAWNDADDLANADMPEDPPERWTWKDGNKNLWVEAEDLDAAPYTSLPPEQVASMRAIIVAHEMSCQAVRIKHRLAELEAISDAALDAQEQAEADLVLRTAAPGPAEAAYKLRLARLADDEQDLDDPDTCKELLVANGDYRSRSLVRTYCDLLHMAGLPAPPDALEPWDAAQFVDQFLAAHVPYGWSESHGSPSWPAPRGASFDMWNPLPKWKRILARREICTRVTPWTVETISRELRENFYPGNDAPHDYEGTLAMFVRRKDPNPATIQAIRDATADLLEAQTLYPRAVCWVVEFTDAGGTIDYEPGRGVGPDSRPDSLLLGRPKSPQSVKADRLAAEAEGSAPLMLAIKTSARQRMFRLGRDVRHLDRDVMAAARNVERA